MFSRSIGRSDIHDGIGPRGTKLLGTEKSPSNSHIKFDLLTGLNHAIKISGMEK
jgi:hypothetical protein